MRINRALRTNILWTILSRYGSQILAVVSSLILARYLGSSGFGEYTFISAIVMIGNALSTFGTDMVLVRRISSDRDYSDLSTALVIQLLISFLFIMAVFGFYSFLPVAPSLLIYVFALLPMSFFTIFSIALRGTHELQAFSALHFGTAVFQLIAALLLVFENGTVMELAMLLMGAQIFGALMGFLLCVSRIEKFFFIWKFSWGNVFLLLRASFQMAAIGTLRLVYEKLAVTLLPALSGVAETGLFAASIRVMNAAKLGHMSALTAIYPEMARNRRFVAHRSGFHLLLVSAVFISLILFLFAEQIVFILFGEQFASSVESLRIVAWIIAPYFIVSYYSLAFIAIEVEGPVLRSLVASLLLMLILLLTLTPQYSLGGAAIALLLAEIFQAALLWIHWRTHVLSKSSQ